MGLSPQLSKSQMHVNPNPRYDTFALRDAMSYFDDYASGKARIASAPAKVRYNTPY